MHQNQPPFILEAISNQVTTSKAANDEVNLAAVSQEVIIRPLPPEIDKLVREYISRY